MKNASFLKWLVGITVLTIVFVFFLRSFRYVGSVQRFSKGLESNWGGGLKRTVTLYDEHGKLLRQWYGKIDIADATDELDFIVEGRRIIIHGGIAVIEEEK